MSFKQWVIIEVLVLANVLAGAVGGVLLFLQPALDVFADPGTPLALITPPPALTETATPAQTLTLAPALVLAPTENASPTATPFPTETFIPTQTLVVEPTLSLTPSLTPTSVVVALSATPTPTATFAAEYRLTVEGHPQSLPLSCESRSAVDWAAYFGVGIDEIEFFNRLPVSDNPEVGFVGDVNGSWGQIPPNAYGVHAEPVAALLRAYGVTATAMRDMTWDDAQSELRAGRPLEVWVVGHVWSSGRRYNYTAQDGQVVRVAPYEHTVLLIGYNATDVYILDGDTVYTKPIDAFLGSWAVLGNMAVVGR